MPHYTTTAIRNLAIVGPAGSGKTSLAEALLKQAGTLGHRGTVDAKDTVSDFADEEHHHGHSLFASVMHCDHGGVHVNLIDTPGMPDFIGQALSVFPAVETMALVISADSNVDAVTRRLMQQAASRNLCRMIIVNKIDAEHADPAALMDQLRETFGNVCLPINLPADSGKRVVDCFFTGSEKAGDSDFGPISDAHTAIVDQVVEVDEDLMTLYLEQGEVTPEQLHEPFEKALREGHLIPVCFASSAPHDGGDPIGIDTLLEAIEKLAPNPMEGNPRPFIRGTDMEHEIHADPDPDKHVLGHVFNVRIDPFVGKLCAFRVHQGTITPQTQLFIDDVVAGESKKPFKVGHLFKLQGKEHVEVDGAIPGDLVAVAKVENVHFDAVLHDSHDEDMIHLRPIAFPNPMAGLAIEATSRGDEQKLADALHKMQEEDPTFSVTRDATTGETVIHGLGDLHLRIALEKLKDRYHVNVQTKTPKIAYRETIGGKAEGHHRHKKQTGGAGQFGEVYLRIEPLERGQGFEFVNDTFGGSIPSSFIPAIEKGVRQAMQEGALAGCPIQDVRVSVYDGKHHSVDSKEIAFITAGKKAFLDAFGKARPSLLEPLVSIEVTASNRHMGDITADLSGRRGRIQGTDMLAGDQAVIEAIVPLSELANYGSQINSITGGQASFSMELSHYEPLPAHLQEKIIAAHNAQPVGA